MIKLMIRNFSSHSFYLIFFLNTVVDPYKCVMEVKVAFRKVVSERLTGDLFFPGCKKERRKLLDFEMPGEFSLCQQPQ